MLWAVSSPACRSLPPAPVSTVGLGQAQTAAHRADELPPRRLLSVVLRAGPRGKVRPIAPGFHSRGDYVCRCHLFESARGELSATIGRADEIMHGERPPLRLTVARVSVMALPTLRQRD